MAVRLVAHEEALPGYRLIERLGRGGFGEVWKAEAPGGLLKAIKFVFGDLDAADEESRPAEQELKALKRVQAIRHPYVLSLERYDILDGQLIIVMELADRNLWDRFRECRAQGLPGVPRDELLRYMEEAAEALDLMNNHYQIQHLDIKPQNLFVVHNHVKVGDFGLAKLLEGVRATVTGGVTPVYAAPETFEGWVSRFSDQYSLGIVFQELLTGTRPFNGANTRQLLMQHINGKPELGSLPEADRAVIARALAKKPDDRWPTCSELVRSLKLSGLNAPPATPSPGTPTTPPPGDSAMATRPAGSRPRPGDSTPPPKAQTPRSNGTAVPGPMTVPNSAASGTPIPSVAAPGPAAHALAARLVTPQAAALSPAITLQRAQVVQTGRMSALGIAPPERTGDGVLFPALVVAVGQTGRMVAEQLRRVIRAHHGSTDRVPNVRFLAVDTDPESGAAGADDPAAFTPRETVAARLNRPAHYLQQSHLPGLDGWLPTGALYKLPRVPVSTGGVRAYGRLALFDNYRLVAQRVRQEVEAFLTDEPLAAADKATGLGLRTNRPRVYVVAGLGGGTGGGMFLDLAYLVRHEFRSVGYTRPEVVGLFLVPPADPKSPRSAALGNAHAALTELYHFQAKKTRYQAAFDKGEAPVVDPDAPFARTVVLELPGKIDPREQRRVTGQAARAVFNEVLTPAGRVVDEVRDVYRAAYPSTAPTCETFGLYRLIWPRPEVLAAATGRFAQKLLTRWTAKDAAHLQEPIANWLSGQWTDRRLSFDPMAEGFLGAVQKALREDPDRVFDAFIDPLRTRTPSSGKLDAAAACGVLDQLIKVVGKPPSEEDASFGSLHPVLAAHYAEVAKETEVGLATMAVSFIEQPQYRLAGAEEAVRQLADKLKRQVDTLAPVRADLDAEVKSTYGRLFQVIGALNAGGGIAAIPGRRAGMTAEALDLLRAYPRKRLQLHVLDFCLSVYRKLLGNAPEYLREISFCRASVTDMTAALSKAAGPPAGPPVGPGKLVLPDGCANLEMAADQFLANLDPADIVAFDQDFQKLIAKKFRGLAAICLKPVEKGPHFRALLLEKAREFLESRLDAADPATAFLRYCDTGPAGLKLLAEAHEKAAPNLLPPTGAPPGEVTILAVPATADGAKLRGLFAEAVPGADLTPAPLPNDICVYRETPRLELTRLPQLGEPGREAFDHLAETFPPHARLDIPWQPAGT